MITDEVEELELLKEFRILVEDLNQDGLTLKRFLRARNHDLDKAEDMLRKSLEWRRENKVDEALSWVPLPEAVDAFPIEYPGVDRKNQVVMYGHVGSWLIRQMFEKGYEEQMRQLIYIHLEKLMGNIERSGEQLFTVIVDLEGLSYWDLGRYEIIQIAFKIFKDFEANYPERLSEAFVLYSPLVVNYAWPLFRPLMTGTTQQKIKFLGSNCHQFIPQLLERIPLSSLPDRLHRIIKLNKVRVA